MSIRLMTAVWQIKMHHVHKIVLLALADNASDEGECYPSLQTMMKKCSLSERAIQAAYVDLEKWQCLRRVFRSGRSTIYVVTPAQYAPPQDMHPAQDAPTPAQCAPPPPHNMRDTPAQYAPITINQPSVESSLTRQGACLPIPIEDFEPVKQAYPTFAGRQDWITAEHNWRNRLDEGYIAADMLAAVKRYATYCTNGGASSDAHVMRPAIFFSAADKPWTQLFPLPQKRQQLSVVGGTALKLRTAEEIEAEELARGDAHA